MGILRSPAKFFFAGVSKIGNVLMTGWSKKMGDEWRTQLFEPPLTSGSMKKHGPET